jgi:hypothetical protein
VSNGGQPDDVAIMLFAALLFNRIFRACKLQD